VLHPPVESAVELRPSTFKLIASRLDGRWPARSGRTARSALAPRTRTQAACLQVTRTRP